MFSNHRRSQITPEGDENHNETKKLEILCINSLKKYNIYKFKLRKYTKDDCIIYNASKEIQYASHNRKNTEKIGITTERTGANLVVSQILKIGTYEVSDP